MTDIFAVLFVFCIIFASVLSNPTKKMRVRQINDRAASTVAMASPCTVTALEVNDSSHDQEKQHETIEKTVKIPQLFGDRQNKLKDRSLVKIIRKSKTPRYKLRDPIAQNDLFSPMGHGNEANNNNSIQFQEIYSLGKTGKNENYILVNPKLQLPNISISNIPIPQNKQEFVYTYLPVASLTNGSEIELIKNTILRSQPTSNTKKPIEKNDSTVASRRAGKHNVRKYFKLHSSIAKELEENSYMNGHTQHVLSGPSGPGVHWPSPPAGTGNVKGTPPVYLEPAAGDVTQSHTTSPRMQSIVLRWNLILI